MDPVAPLLIAAGLAIVVAGGEIVVRSASRLARGLGLSPVVIGLTVVAFGTSAPELAVSVGASLGGSTDVAVGNVVGSNIYNVLLILGLSAAAFGAKLLNVPFMANPGIVALAFLFSGAVGVVFGYFPARKAARLDPIEALRHE
jgi:cation:H+ antiporter